MWAIGTPGGAQLGGRAPTLRPPHPRSFWWVQRKQDRQPRAGLTTGGRAPGTLPRFPGRGSRGGRGLGAVARGSAQRPGSEHPPPAPLPRPSPAPPAVWRARLFICNSPRPAGAGLLASRAPPAVTRPAPGSRPRARRRRRRAREAGGAAGPP